MRSRTCQRLTAVSAAVLAATAAGIVPAAAVPGPAAVNLGFAAKITTEGRACSGALVEPALVLTAASCLAGNPAEKPVSVTVGSHVAKVTAVLPRTDRDVALVRIDTTITDVATLKLGATAGVPGASEELTLAGWGRTDTEWLPNEAHTGKFTVSASSATTLSLTGAADACKGDAGAPVFRADGTLVAVAGASWQHGCLGETGTRQGTTAARADDLRDWIRGLAITGTATAAGHGVTLNWTPLAASDDATYSVYASPDGPAAYSAEQFIGSTKSTTLLHSATAHKTWHYLVMVSVGVTSPQIVVTTRGRSASDFTGDGKDDIATFTRGTAADAYTATSDGTKFVGNEVKWHDNLAADGELPLGGDFNGDGKVDTAVFKRGSSGDVVVALSDGTKYGTATLWHDFFGIGAEIPAVGDFNGDGKDDIAVFVRGSTADVFVALSDGTKFGTSAKWHDYFAPNDEVPAVGDFNGDGKDDIATFTRGTTGDVYVALSDGTRFVGNELKWHDYFGIAAEVPTVGDFNGDGKDDIVVFVRGTAGDVYVALSDGTKFGTSALWHEFFGINGEIPAVGDFDGDGKADLGLFVRGSAADVFVARSEGTRFGTSAKWHDFFAYNAEVPVPRAITVL
ncbi:Repeat domain-containing protein [Amycolatopsis tolypomycina]|uniref:Repeat domain-containing protein n=1 Tax=Amycolatopsis tolypomycina TaxID=208445 RepID=A0A1H4QN79_9PSEU|nr:FG-GAP-like repeat-containing protein [Amycolatopsis tolypomycina]SEC21022.1 Repeat domain-containing protein [Amycolatopsis tolypomycina]